VDFSWLLRRVLVLTDCSMRSNASVAMLLLGLDLLSRQLETLPAWLANAVEMSRSFVEEETGFSFTNGTLDENKKSLRLIRPCEELGSTRMHLSIESSS
jgi:hypothetical protein